MAAVGHIRGFMNATLMVRDDEELGSPAFFANPYPTYARLRTTTPVCWSDAWQAWIVTRYADVLAVLQDARRFSNAGRQAHLLERLTPEVRSTLSLWRSTIPRAV